MIGLAHYLILAAGLFAIGTLGVLTRRNILIIFLSIELMLNAVNLAFAAASRYLHNVDGQAFVFIIIAVAAAEAAVGLSILVAIYRLRGTLNVDQVNIMRW